MKKILLIMPKYFGYEKYICERLEKRGFKVYLLYENLDEISLLYRFIYVYKNDFKLRLIKHYYERKYNRLPENIEVVLVIRGETITEEIIGQLKSRYRNAKYIMYQWDSTNNNSNAVMVAKYFDDVLTFDPVDAKKYKWKYRPLFYIPELCKSTHKTFDIAYICMLHSERVQILKKLKKICKENKFSLFSYLYQKFPVYLKHKYLQKESIYKSIDRGDIKSRALSLEQTYGIYKRAKVIVDYASPRQNGLTMRSIESLGTNCKLITNNPNIVNEPFYNKQNICLYSFDSFAISNIFLNSGYVQINEEQKKYYSIDGWMDDLLRCTR